MLIQNGMIINDTGRAKMDIRMEGKKITCIREKLCPEIHEEVMDAAGYYILPGGVDAHVHLDMPAGNCKTSDDYLSGTKAAVMGGTTAVIDFAEYEEGESLRDGLDRWMEKAGGKAWCDYSFHMTVSGWDGTSESQIESMIRRGIPSFKAYTAYRDGIGVEDAELLRILQCMKKNHTLLCVHCEDDDMMKGLKRRLWEENPGDIRNHPKSRPNLVEKEAVQRVIDMAAAVDVPVYIVHVSTREAMEVILRARQRGQEVYAETCPQYLLLNEEKYGLPGFEGAKYVLSPPLRSAKDQEFLWEAAASGKIDVIATDHCSFNYKGQKELGRNDFTEIPNGIPGIENRMALMLSYGKLHGIRLEEIVRMTSADPARIFGLYPVKGAVSEGSDGDLILARETKGYRIRMETQHQEVDYTPYEGLELTYEIAQVFVKGRLAVKDGRWLTDHPEGEFLAVPCGKK